jgi:voltage-gated potassium channel
MHRSGTVTVVSTPATLDPEPDEEATPRERLAGVLERRLDIPMAFLALVWAGLIAYELIVPADQRRDLTVVGNVIWAIFVVEFVTKLVVSGHPLRFLRRRWPSILFLALPILRVLRVIRAIRAFRALPAARVVGSSYRAIGTARSLLGSRIAFLVVTSAVVIFSGAQLLYLVEGEGGGREGSFGDALWWSANAAISGNQVFEPETAGGRLFAVTLSAYAVVVFASVAASLGAFFIESRAERAAAEEASATEA